jgi:hypothetical protein
MQQQVRDMLGLPTHSGWKRDYISPVSRAYNHEVSRHTDSLLRQKVNEFTLADTAFVSMWHFCDMYAMQWQEAGL